MKVSLLDLVYLADFVILLLDHRGHFLGRSECVVVDLDHGDHLADAGNKVFIGLVQIGQVLDGNGCFAVAIPFLDACYSYPQPPPNIPNKKT